MKATLILSCLSLFATLISCRNKDTPTDVPLSDEKTTDRYEQIKEFDWLLGTWKNYTEMGEFTEKWTKTNDSTFNGYSVILKDNDTLFYEDMVIDQKGDSLHYIVSVKNQSEKPVHFTLKSFTGNRYIFENKVHDFPQRITYTKVSADSLIAEISGMQNGNPAMEEFPMIREK